MTEMVRPSLSLAHLVLAAGVLLLPLEMPLTEAMHGILSRHIGDWYLLVHPFTLVLVGVLWTRRWAPKRLDLALAAMAVGIFISTIILRGDVEWAVRYIWFGILSISATAITARDGSMLRLLVWGFGLWALVGLGFYVWYFATDDAIRSSLAEKIMMLRSPGPSVSNTVPFFLYLGNMNKAANYAVLAMLLAVYCEATTVIKRLVALTVYALMIGILIVTFSRGALVVCGLLAVGLWIVSIRSSKIGNAKLRWIGAAFAVPLLLSLSTPEYRSYWTNFDTVETRVMMAAAAIANEKAPKRADLGNVTTPATSSPRSASGPAQSAAPETPPSVVLPTAAPSAAVAKTLTAAATRKAPPSAVQPSSVPRPNPIIRALLGYGVGNYGAENFNDPVRGTHNLFIDVWTDGGLVAVAAFLVYLLLSLKGAIRHALALQPEALAAIAGILSIVILGFREYDLAYLYATSLGGALVGSFCGLAISSGRPLSAAKRPAGVKRPLL